MPVTKLGRLHAFSNGTRISLYLPRTQEFPARRPIFVHHLPMSKQTLAEAERAREAHHRRRREPGRRGRRGAQRGAQSEEQHSSVSAWMFGEDDDGSMSFSSLPFPASSRYYETVGELQVSEWPSNSPEFPRREQAGEAVVEARWPGGVRERPRAP